MKTKQIFSRVVPVAFLVVACLFGGRAAAAPAVELQGQSRGSTDWVTGTLQNWRELDDVPVRFYLTDGPVVNQTITIQMPHSNGTTPAFESLVNFMASPNATITEGPFLEVWASGTWVYALKVTVSNSSPAFVEVRARLAKDSHLNLPGSLKLQGSPSTMGILEVAVPPAPLPPTVSITSPTNGSVFLSPANFPLTAEAEDADGTITGVEFFQGASKLGETAIGDPYQLQVTGLVPGNYSFTAIATDHSGLSATSAPVNITVIDALPLTLGAIRFNPQSGLYEQKATVSNPTSASVSAVRVQVNGLATGITVRNASGFSNGIPYVQSLGALAPGQTVDFVIEYHLTASGIPNATLSVEALSVDPGGVAVALGDAVRINRIVPQAAGYMVEFNTEPGFNYFIEYSSDMSVWKQVRTPVIGTGTWVQWIDNGPPKTESAPTPGMSRFYRVIVTP